MPEKMEGAVPPRIMVDQVREADRKRDVIQLMED